MPLFSSARSKSSSSLPNSASRSPSNLESHDAPQRGQSSSPSAVAKSFLGRHRASSNSNTSPAPNSTSTSSNNTLERSTTPTSTPSSSSSSSFANKFYAKLTSSNSATANMNGGSPAHGAQAYLAALAARSDEKQQQQQQPIQQHPSDASSTYSSSSSSIFSESAYSLRSRSSNASAATSVSAKSAAGTFTSPTSSSKKQQQQQQQNDTKPTSPSSFPSSLLPLKKRSRGRSLSQILGLETEEERVVYSNDYRVPLEPQEVVQLSKYPPKNANKIYPARHFDPDPFWIPPEEASNPYALNHSEFGYNGPDGYKFQYESRFRPTSGVGGEEIEEPSHWVYITTYISYIILIVIGHLRDFIGKRTHRKSYQHLMPYNGYAALNSDFDSFYTRRLKARIEDLFARPVTGVAGRTITCLDRISTDHYATFRFTGLTTQALNISSYNYLGFNQSRGGISDSVERTIEKYSVSSLGNREDSGTLDLHVYTERLISKFLGVEDALLISQGFATNSATLPVLVSKGCLVISDEFNHASIRFGVRLSGATVRQYKHNDMKDLENLLRESISQGQPRTHRPWKKILLICEGLYSMEGTLVDLPKIMQLKRLYKFYLYVDEAHSIGALGPRGRGVCDYFGIDPNEVDIMMGTLTKSFGAAGGYIGGSREMISHMRKLNHSSVYGEAHSPAVLMQIISAIVSIMGQKEVENVIPSFLYRDMPARMLDGSEGVERLRRLAFNSRYLSTGLRKLGFIVYGHRDSPIVPLLMFSPGKMGAFSRMMLEKFNIVTVVVAYPATPLVSSRVRFCVSAAHTKQDIDRVLLACDVVGDLLGLKLSNRKQHKRMKIQDIIDNAVELVESQ